MPLRSLALVGIVLYAGLIAWATLGPVPWRNPANEAANGVFTFELWADPATWSQGTTREFVANVLMFLPLGALLVIALGARRWWLAALLSLGATLAIEVVQWPMNDRISDPRDLVANTAGALVGIALAAALARRRPALSRAAR